MFPAPAAPVAPAKTAAATSTTTIDKIKADAAGPVTIEITKDAPFLVGEKRVHKIVVDAISFEAYAACAAPANRNSVTQEQYRKLLTRARIMAQAKVFDAKGHPMKPSEGEWLMLPRVYVPMITAALQYEPGTAGKIVVKGDGVAQPTVYKLGTPLSLGGSGSGEAITELEFMSRTLGDIEDVLAEETTLSQAMALIRHCAKPLGMGEVSMSALPAWASAQITLLDGVVIMQGVLPSFL